MSNGLRLATVAAAFLLLPRPMTAEAPGPAPLPVEWVRIEGGTFDMGSTHGPRNESPVHAVTVPTFEMTRTEVTTGQYRACVATGACTAPNIGGGCNWNQAGRENHPINCVDWHQAAAFATWSGGRLPSEAEWEYAARSRGTRERSGSPEAPVTCERAVMNEGVIGCGRGLTWPVCSKPAGNTREGLCDMAGNVLEWIQDWYHDSYHGAPSDGSAWDVPAGLDRVDRGGGLLDPAEYQTGTRRNQVDPAFRGDYIGFRIVRPVSK